MMWDNERLWTSVSVWALVCITLSVSGWPRLASVTCAVPFAIGAWVLQGGSR